MADEKQELEKESEWLNPGAPLTLGGPARMELPKAADPSSFLYAQPGIPTMAAPPKGAFTPLPGLTPTIENAMGSTSKWVGGVAAQNRGRPPNKPSPPPPPPPPTPGRWSGAETQRLYLAAKAGKSPADMQEIFPNRTMRAIQNQIERLFGGQRYLRGTPKGGKRYPLLKEDEFSQIHPTIREWITRPGEIQVAGDVVGFPKTLQEQDANRLKGKEPTMQGGAVVPSPPFGFDPQGDMTGGGKVVPGPGYTSQLETDKEVG